MHVCLTQQSSGRGSPDAVGLEIPHLEVVFILPLPHPPPHTPPPLQRTNSHTFVSPRFGSNAEVVERECVLVTLPSLTSSTLPRIHGWMAASRFAFCSGMNSGETNQKVSVSEPSYARCGCGRHLNRFLAALVRDFIPPQQISLPVLAWAARRSRVAPVGPCCCRLSIALPLLLLLLLFLHSGLYKNAHV